MSFSSYWSSSPTDKGSPVPWSDSFGYDSHMPSSGKSGFNWSDVGRFAGQFASGLSGSRSGSGGYGGYGGGFGGYGGGGFGGGGVQQSGDLTVVYPNQMGPYTIPGQQGSSKGSTIGGLLGTVAGIALAPVTGGASLALGPQIGGGIGSLF